MPNDLDAYLDPAPNPRRRNYDDLIEKHARRTNLDPNLVKAVVVQESRGNPRAVSPKNAQGIMQLIPATAKRFGVKNVFDPEENIRGGTDYLRFLSDRFKGNRDLVLAGYNAGEGAVDKFKGIPPYKETQNYVRSINKKLGGSRSTPQQSQGDLDNYLDPLDDYLDAPLPTPTPQPKPKRSRFEGIRAGVKGQRSAATADPFALLKSINAQPSLPSPDDALREQAMTNVTSFTVDPVANVRSLIGAARRGTQAQVDTEAEEEFQRLKAAEERAKTPEMTAIRKEYGRMPTVPTAMGVPVQTRSIAQPLARTAGGLLKMVGGLTSAFGLKETDLSKWANTRGQVIEEAASLPPLNEAGEEIKRRLPEKIQTALNDTGLGIVQIIVLKKATGLPLGQLMALETAARTSDEPLDKRAGQVAESYAMGRVLQQHLSRPASAALFGAPTAAREGQQVLQGASLEDAILNTAVQSGVGFGLGGKPRARQTETQRQGVSAEQSTESTTRQGTGVISPDTAVQPDVLQMATEQPQHFYHTQYGNVVKAADQSGARKGKTKVYVESNPEEIHYPKTVDLRGRGNERMVPLKESASEPTEAPVQPAELRQQEGARTAIQTPPSPEIVKPDVNELRQYGQSLVAENKGIKGVKLIGSTAAKGEGRDVDVLYDLGDLKLPKDEGAATERIIEILERHDNLRPVGDFDVFAKVGDRYFYQAKGAGVSWVENSEYGRQQASKPSVDLVSEQPIKEVTDDERAAVERVHVSSGYWKEPATSVAELRTRAAERRDIGDWATADRLDSQANRIESRLSSIREVTDVTQEAEVSEKPKIGETGAGGGTSKDVTPAPTKRSRHKGDFLVTGERSDISLSQFVRKRGGIVPMEMFKGELDRLRSPDTGTTGLINKHNRRGGRKMTADYMMEAANEAGFKDPQTGEKFENVGNFLYAIERDVATKNIKALTGTEVDFEKEYRKHVDTQIAEEKDRVDAEKSALALESLLEVEGGRAGELFDKIVANNATPAEQAEFRDLTRKRFIRNADIEAVIAEAKAENVPISFEGEREATPSRGRAEQLGFVQEGLTQESAKLPPKGVDQRARLIQEEKQRQRERNPERAAALDTLAMLHKKGMTVDDYARQGSLIGETPSPQKIALLRELESGNFGPGAASAKEPFPEVKERKFGKRFVEDERIAQEIRDSIGTAKYYEPIPNKVTAADAKKLVDERGVGQSINAIKDEGNNIPFHVRVAMGEIVALRANKAYKNLKETNPKEAEFILDQANETAEFLMDLGTRLGQGVQAYRMWSAQTPEGILLSYQKGVAKARQRTAKIVGEDVKEIVDTVNKELSHGERVEELKKLFKTNKTARKVRSQMDQLLEATKDRKLEDKDFYDIVGDRLGLPKYDPKVASRIMSLAEQIADAPEGLPRDRKIFQLNKYLAEQKGFDVGDLPIGIYYGNILSGYNTHIVNSVDTALNVISEINGLAINNPRAAAKIYGGLLRGFSEGKLDAILTLTEGRMVTDGKWLEVPRLMEVAEFGKKGGVPISTATRRGRAVKKIAESKVGYPLNAYKFVTRMLAASDAVMFRSAKEARASLLAHRMAQAEGLTGDVLDAKVRSILALDRRVDFEKQAEREGFTGTAAKVRTAELIDMVRNKEVSNDAADFAGEATYNHKPHGALGYASEVIGKWSEQYKALKLFVPFTRIVANVTNRGLNWTPYGFKRAAFGYSHGEALTPENRRLMITRATVGTVGLVTLGAMQEAGLLQIHGAGPSDREKKRQLQNAGWRPYSIQIGNTYVSYVYSPTGLGLSIIGNMTDSQRYHELEQKDAATRGAYAVARLGSTVFSQSFLSGLSRLFNALSESPSESVSAVKQTMSSTVAAATTPNLARDIYRLFDNKAYQSNTLMEDLVRNTPFAALALKPQLNAFGEPVRVQRQRFFDVQTSDPAWQFVIQKGLKVPVPGRTLEIGKDERITPEQYYELLAVTGPRVKQWIVMNRARLSKLKEDDAQDELQQAATRIRKFELTRMRLLARRKKAA